MEASAPEDAVAVRRFNPLRSVRRGLNAACRWTVRLGRGRAATASGHRTGRRAGRGRVPPLASLSAAILEPEELLDLGDEPSTSGHQQRPATMVSALHLQVLPADSGGNGSVFPLVVRRPQDSAFGLAMPHVHHRSAQQYHAHAVDNGLYTHHHYQRHHHHNHQQLLPQFDDTPWIHHHDDSSYRSACTCGGLESGAGCHSRCSAAGWERLQGHGRDGLSVSSAAAQDAGRRAASCAAVGMQQQAQGQVGSHGQEDSLQHLLAVGSRQWGGGSWWDGRGLLRVKIYDFAIYADPAKAAHALRSAAVSPSSPREHGHHRSRAPGCGDGGSAPSARPAELLVPPGSQVDMSLTIRACRNLPLHLLSQEFERVLQRRHQKAGGRPDDPAFRELLSYFSVGMLPDDVLVTTSATSPSSVAEDAVRKGASITFSRSACGSLVTEAGGRVLGRVQSPALAEALFDLYLGEQPVSKRAKAAAGAALLEMASAVPGARDGGGYRYRPQPGERLLCGPGARGPQDVEACVLQLP